jgi:hypothetical protein
MEARKVITLARRHLGAGMESSARLALEDAVSLYDAGKFDDAAQRAAKSIAYSVGVHHADYRRVVGEAR